MMNTTEIINNNDMTRFEFSVIVACYTMGSIIGICFCLYWVKMRSDNNYDEQTPKCVYIKHADIPQATPLDRIDNQV